MHFCASGGPWDALGASWGASGGISGEPLGEPLGEPPGEILGDPERNTDESVRFVGHLCTVGPLGDSGRASGLIALVSDGI